MLKQIKKIIPNRYKEKIKRMIQKRKYIQYKEKCKRKNQKEYILFGTPIHGNLGDHAIAMAEYEMLRKCQIEPFEVPTYEAELCYSYLVRKIEKDAVILITGGGSIGSEWLKEEMFIRKIIQDFKEHKIIIFPQTIFYKNDETGRKQKEWDKQVYAQAKKLYICTREQKSYELAKTIHSTAEILLLPDIVLSLENYKSECQRTGILLCIRNDVESNIDKEKKNSIREIAAKFSSIIDSTDTVLNKKITKGMREKEVNEKLKEFSKYKLVITDRLHGMIFAVLTRTPCIAIGNYNYKVEGVYEWLKELSTVQYIKTIKELPEQIEKLYKNNEVDKKIDLTVKYQPLIQIIKGEQSE